MSELPPEEPYEPEPTPVEPEPTPEPEPPAEPEPEVPYAPDEPPRSEESDPEPETPTEPPAGGDFPCPACGNHMIPTPDSPCTWVPPVPVEPPYEEVP
jgi:hypothetical protein